MSNTNQDQPVGGFMFYRSFRDAIRQLPKKQQLALYDAIADYALDGTLPSLDNKISQVLWTLMQPSIDRCKKTSQSQPAHRGAPVGNRNASKHKNDQPNAEEQQAPPPVPKGHVSCNTVAAKAQEQKPVPSVPYAVAQQRRNPQDPPPLHREIAEISRDQSWIESVCMLFHLQPAQLTPYFSGFRLECEARNRLQHTSLTDCKQHFASYLRIQIEKKQSNEQSEKRKALRRRSDVPPPETTNYHSAL